MWPSRKSFQWLAEWSQVEVPAADSMRVCGLNSNKGLIAKAETHVLAQPRNSSSRSMIRSKAGAILSEMTFWMVLNEFSNAASHLKIFCRHQSRTISSANGLPHMPHPPFRSSDSQAIPRRQLRSYPSSGTRTDPHGPLVSTLVYLSA